MSQVLSPDVLRWLAPEAVLVLGALVVLFGDARLWREADLSSRSRAAAWLGGVVLLAAAGSLLLVPRTGAWGAGMVVAEPGLVWVKGVLLLLAAGCVVLGDDPPGGPDHPGEFVALLLLATTGLLLVAGSAHLLLIFLGLELASLSLYALAGFDRARRPSADAALRYFLVGAVAAAFLLYGVSLLHGLTGTLDLRDLAGALGRSRPGPLHGVAVACILAGLGFKVAAAPFHLWVPDVYAGAPRPVAALVASASKVAGFLVLVRVLSTGLAGWEGSAAWGAFEAGWMPLVALLAAASVAAGNLTALAQSRLRRLLAWSAVAHAGYALVALLSPGPDARTAVLFHAITYAVSLVGIFALVRVFERDAGDAGDRIAGLAGIGRRAPWLGAALGVQMLSLAGVPPAAGFFGKYLAFTAALHGPGGTGHLWLVLTALGFSCAGMVYYLRVLHAAAGPAGPGRAGDVAVRTGEAVVIAVSSLVTLGLGIWPSGLLDLLR